MNKLWLTLITQNREQDIDELTKETFDFFDGIVGVVNQPSDDKTYDILNERKKAGQIIKRPFVKHHGFLMNEFLFSGVIKNLDWFLILDSSDRINLGWLKDLRRSINYYEQNNIGAVFLDRVYLARYIDSMEFHGGVHWGLSPFLGQVINFSAQPGYNKENYIINTRGKDKDSIERSGIRHPIKYYLEYGANSHTQLLYQQFGNDVWQKHENSRMQFRIYCESVLGFECTVNNLIDYIKTGILNKTLPNEVTEFIETEVSMQDLVRYYILKHNFLGEIAVNRFNWSFKKFYYQGAEHQNKNDGFVGLFNQYRLAQGKEME